MQKGKLFFNIIIGISIVAFILTLGYIAYYYIRNYIDLKEAQKAIEEFENQVIVVGIEDNENEIVNETTPQTTSPSTTGKKTSSVSYKNYAVIGIIEIPKTKIKALIVDKVTPSSITAAVGMLYGPGLNEIGNTVLAAHNYRNGTFFSNNKKLKVGDTIYITDSQGNKVEYHISKTYTADAMDFSYATRDTDGKREISLSTCVTDPEKRLVIWAKET